MTADAGAHDAGAHAAASEPQPVTAIAPPLKGRPVASQRWSHLLFLHWRVDPAAIAPLLPEGLTPDVHDGSSWVGLIPFVLDRATVFGSPPIPYFGDFVEINVRLYAVDARGRRGVVFVSLEASRLAAVLAAQVLFSLPYRWSRTRLDRSAGLFHYTGVRHVAAPRSMRASSDIVARPSTRAVTGDALADFLTARWGLFASVRGRTVFLRNHHDPWPLFEADLIALNDTLLARAGFAGLAERVPDSILYSPGVTTWFGTDR